MKKLTSICFLLLFYASLPLFALDARDGISISNENGRAVVTYKGRKVWSGRVSGAVVGQASNINSKELAAAWDGKKVVWENVPGAAAQIGRGNPNGAILPLLPAGAVIANTDISVSTQNGETVVKYKGREVWKGKTSDQVTSKASNDNGTELAAVWDGARVVWENVPGAARLIQ